MLRHLVAWAPTCACAVMTMAAPAAAQDGLDVRAPAGMVPAQATCFKDAAGKAVCPAGPGVLASASSTPIEADVTPTTATAASGAVAFASGTAIMGPFTPVLGRDLRAIIRPSTVGGSWAGTVAIGTSSAANACAAGTINALTVAGQTWASFTASANEVVDTPTLANVVYCATATITSGSVRIAVRQ